MSLVELDTDVLIVGGGLGGVAAALAALRTDIRVTLTEEYCWLGGQITSQAVPFDEHTWVEQFGVTASYRTLRDQIRNYYRTWYPLTERARADRHLNPGAGRVGRLCAEPRAALHSIEACLAPHLASGRLTILRRYRPVGAQVEGDSVRSVTVEHADTRDQLEISARFFLDATEMGDLLPLTGTPYRIGFESQAETGEPSAPSTAQPQNQQAFSWCFVVDHVPGDHRIDKPKTYAFWRNHRPAWCGGPLLSLTGPDARTLEPLTRTFNPNPDDDPHTVVGDQRSNPGDRDLWTFRRILARRLFRPGSFPSDLVLVNWPMIDYVEGNLVDVTPDERARHEEAAREQSLSLLYWLQNEAPRPDGGTGWPGLRLRGDVTGAEQHGLAMAPYIRESRRIKAETTVTEGDLSIAATGERRPRTYSDSVGVGMYRIDLHPSSGGDTFIDLPSRPFEIPLGALVPERTENLLAAAKNVGTTHIANGAFRLHPVEWNIGEAAGALAAFCLDRKTTPHQVRARPEHLKDFQSALEKAGVELHWPEVAGY